MDQEYYVLLEQLLQHMTSFEEFNLEKVNSSLEGLCKVLRVSKGVTRFYDSLRAEKLDQGEVFVCYDSGEEEASSASLRLVTEANTVAIATVYLAKGQEPWTDLERERIELVEKIVLSFISRSRLQRIVAKLTLFDGDGYPNLRFFFDKLSRLAQDRPLDGKVSLHFNLKHFNLVNQQIGRKAGTMVMRGFYDHVKETMGEDGILCRLGGDNFVAFFDGEKLEAVLGALGGTRIVYDAARNRRIMVSASAGVFMIPEGFEFHGPDEIMEKIIPTSQMARSGKHGDIVFYNQEFAENREHAAQIQQDFPLALKYQEFKVYYQPKIDVETKELAGAEALCRWFHDGEIVPPMEFIPVLEQSMDICKLDFYMLEQVCKDIRRWLDEGKPVVRISVNLSRKHMMDPDLYEHIMQIVDTYRVPHEYLEIELTETTTDVEFVDLKRVVSQLQQVGISASVDDFGIGYSSLNLLKEIPWDVLKVDKSFLPLPEDGDKSTRSIMFRHVVAMAKELGLECVAEGVESEYQVNLLRQNHCDLAQGFFFDKPLPMADFESRLRSLS